MILYKTKLFSTYVENLLTIFSELFCFRNIHSSSSLLFASLAQTRNCTALLSELLRASSSCHILLKILKKTISSTNAISLEAAIFHSMAFKLSLVINNDQITIPTKRAFLKVLYKVCKIKKKQINIEQNARIHFDGPKIAVCETVSETTFVVNSSFTTKDNCFYVALDETCNAFNQMMHNFEYMQKLEIYDPNTHQVLPPQHHPLY